MIFRSSFRMSAALALAAGIIGTGPLHGQGSTWRAPSSAAVRVSEGSNIADQMGEEFLASFMSPPPEYTRAKIANSTGEEYQLTSSQEWKAKPGDAFEMKVRILVDMRTQALPELVCYDAA